MSADTLDSLEKEEFLKWRRSLALLEEKDGIVLTPFERNLEFWRQLWRVVERSDVVVQVVDARQPLLYYSRDLETYIHEVDPKKTSVVLVNKSDFLTNQQRAVWAEYFRTIGINAIFWSAVLASEQMLGRNSTNITERCDILTETIDEISSESDSDFEETETESDANSDASEGTICEEFNEKAPEVIERSTHLPNEVDCKINSCDSLMDANEVIVPISSVASNSVKLNVIDSETAVQYNTQNGEADTELVGVEKLISLLTEKFGPSSRDTKNPLTIGFIGYPNVGKSSTLNAILGHKKVPVSVTPGKTKHFQTIYVRSDLILCDCPGLVMPSFAYSRADLVVAGILSIDGMRDYLSPVGL
ncbi:unnamed protein product, partial [Schistosoma turkestanicum]